MSDSKESYLKYKICVVCNVAQLDAPSVIYAKFPQNVNRCRKWIRIIGDVNLLQLSLKKIQYRYVCGNHFMGCYFTKSGKHLTKDAVPTIMPPEIKPLKKNIVRFWPPLITRPDHKVMLKCTQRIVPIKRNVSPVPTEDVYLEEEYLEPYDEDDIAIKHESLDQYTKDQTIIIKHESLDPNVKDQIISINQEALEPHVKECLPSLIPILHHNVPPNSQTTEIYTINKDRQVIPITSKVLHNGEGCIIELSQKRIPAVPKDMALKVVGYKRDTTRTRKCNIVGDTAKPSVDAREMVSVIKKEEKLHHKIRSLQRKNKQLKRMLKNMSVLDEVESPYIKKVIRKAISKRKLNVGFNEFSEEREMAMSMLKRALNAYQYLSCLVPLPNVCALQRISMKEPIYNNTTKCRHLL